ncbi:MAG: flagellar assembly peptidoglycan hydrolase FlgJ [Rhodoferax sp.]
MAYGALSSTQGLAADAASLGNLKLQAGKATPAAIKETAKQFESLFMRELIKSMREATMKSGMLDSPGGDLGTDLLDQQLAVQLSGLPGGLSDVIAQQLSRQMGSAPAGGSGASAKLISSAPMGGQRSVGSAAAPLAAASGQAGFVQQHTQIAAAVEKTSGIPAAYMLGQAGHETGWGKREIKLPDGTQSYNLFGIKADAGWSGKVAEVTTTEYVNGAAQKRVARFRAYDSYGQAFQDYARLITQSPRYAQAREQTGSALAYASGLQRAGYATDPAYADKLSRAINSTLALRRAQA